MEFEKLNLKTSNLLEFRVLYHIGTKNVIIMLSPFYLFKKGIRKNKMLKRYRISTISTVYEVDSKSKKLFLFPLPKKLFNQKQCKKKLFESILQRR